MFDTTSEGIKQLVAGGESEIVEFKRTLPPQDVLARVLAAFANTSGGVLLVGVDERQGIVGVPEERVRTDLERLNSVVRSLTPYPSGGDVGVVDVDGKSVLFATVKPAESGPVRTSRGEYVLRVGSMIRPVSQKDMFPDIARVSKLVAPDRRLRLFIAMSFREEEEPALVDYYRAMERAVRNSQLPIDQRRIDLVEGDYEISQRVMDEIDSADIIIADFTLTPSNVYFELGYARGKGKRIIQTARRGSVLEFDIRNWRTLFYRNATELEAGLLPALVTAYTELVSAG